MSFVSDALTGLSDAVGLKEPLDDFADSVGDVLRNNDLARNLAIAAAIYFAAPYVSQFLAGSGAAASASGTAALEFAAADAAAMASAGIGEAAIAQNLAAAGMTQQGAMVLAQTASMGIPATEIATTLASQVGSAFSAGEVASIISNPSVAANYAKDLAGMGVSEAEIAAELAKSGLSQNAAFELASGAGMGMSTGELSQLAQANGLTMGTTPATSSTWSNIVDKASNLVNPSTQAGSGLWNTLGNLGGAALAGSYTDEQINRTRQIAADAAKAAEFKPYTISTPTSSVNVAKDALNVNLSPNQQTMFNNLEAQALQASQTNPYVDPQGLFNTMLSTVTPQNERDRLALEQRMAAQGRLGVATAAYGGTPEQLALAKAQQEALNTMALNSQLKAGELTNQNIANRGGMMEQMYAPVVNARQDTQQALTAQRLAQLAAESQGALLMEGEKAVAARLAKQQDDYQKMYSGMLGGTNAARTVNDVVSAGKSIWDLGKSFF
jgi:hypothetical protein